MKNEEVYQFRQAAHLYRELRAENQRLREELAEKHRIDLRMNREDNEVFSMVWNNKTYEAVPLAEPLEWKPVFDFDAFDYDEAEIEEGVSETVQTALMERQEKKHSFKLARIGFYVRFAVLVLWECCVWVIHRLGWMDVIPTVAAMLFLFVVASYYRWLQ